jgi:hypothetical protein
MASSCAAIYGIINVLFWQIMSANEGINGVLLDRPPVIELAREAWGKDGPYKSAIARF